MDKFRSNRILISIINSKKTFSKVPSSPFENEDKNKFIFETKEVNDIDEVFQYLQNNFLLNIPLNTKTLKNYKRRENLKNYFVDKLEYLFLDIDHVKSFSDRELLIKFFKDNNYKCIIGESRNPLNLKGVLKVDSINIKEAKLIVKEIDEKLQKYAFCEYDKAVYGMGTHQAPIHKNIILFENLNGDVYPTPKTSKENLNNVYQKNIFTRDNNDDIVLFCKNYFENKGFVFHDKIKTGNTEFFVVSHFTEKKSPKGFRFYPDNPFVMVHFNKSRNFNIFKEIIKTPEYKKIQNTKSKVLIQKILPKIPNNGECNDCIKERYIDIKNHKEKIKQFINTEKQYCIMKIQSPMGTGKSEIIKEIIKQATDKKQRILFLTNRISLADDISKKYPDIKHYLGSELEGNNYSIGDNLVCQIDSLYKFSTKYFDIVIMDEFSTTMEHLLNIEKYQKNISTKIFSLYKKKLAVLDAFIFNDHIKNFITKQTEIIEIINMYRDEIKLNFYKQKDKFIYDLVQTAKNEPITFSSGSINILKIVEILLKEAGISYYIISAETPQEQRKLIYKSLKQNKPKYQVLMYSPTITVGISNENNVYKHYHYDTSQSMGVLQSIQMIKRTRKAKEINIFISERPKYLPTNINEIQHGLMDYIETDEDGDYSGISETGLKISKIIRLNNIMENRHKITFLKLLKYQFCIKNNVKEIEEKVKPFIRKISKIVKENQISKKLDIFQKYRKMTPEEISEIEFKLFSSSPEEEYIKEFQLFKDDVILKKYLNPKEIKFIIKENIIDPSLIQNFKNIVQAEWAEKDKILKLKKIITKKDDIYINIIRNNKKPIEYGYKKMKNVNRWVLKPALEKLIKK